MRTLDRRMAMTLGAAVLAPSVLFPSPAAAEIYARHSGILFLPGIRRVELGHWPVSLAGYKSIMIADYIVEPGSGFPAERIRHDTIYHVLEGEFRVTKGKEFVAKAGALYTCVTGDTREDTNPGQVEAVLRTIVLKTR